MSLVAAWFISNGPMVDRAALPYILYGGPALCIAGAFVLLGIQHALRSLIRPNVNFPQQPTIPIGTPPPLLKNAGGQLERTEVQSDGEVRDDLCTLQLGRQKLPAACCECLSTENLILKVEHGNRYAIPYGESQSITVPVCEPCRNSTSKRSWLIGTVVFLSLLGGSYLGLKLSIDDETFLTIFFITAGLFSLAIAAYIASMLTAPFKYKASDDSRGVLSLCFRNSAYNVLVNQQS